MAFTAEDGTGLADANAGITVEFADAYFADRGETGWTGTTPQKQTAIVRATDYVETRFADKLRGYILVETQALCVPRTDMYDSQLRDLGPVPLAYQQAIAEYAKVALTKVLQPNPSDGFDGAPLKRKREKVGPLEDEWEFQEGWAAFGIVPWPRADALIEKLCYQTSNRVIR